MNTVELIPQLESVRLSVDQMLELLRGSGNPSSLPDKEVDECKANHDENQGLPEEGFVLDPTRNRSRHLYPDWCEPTTWELACSLSRGVEGAGHNSPCFGIGLNARAMNFARLLQDAGKVIRLTSDEIRQTVEGLVLMASKDPRLGKIMSDLRNYPDGAYPAPGESGGVKISRIEQAHRLLGQVGGGRYAS